MGAVAPSHDLDASAVPGITDALSAVSAMLGGRDPGELLGAIFSQPEPDGLAEQVEALRSDIAALRADLEPIVAAFATLVQLPKVRRALARVDV